MACRVEFRKNNNTNIKKTNNGTKRLRQRNFWYDY